MHVCAMTHAQSSSHGDPVTPGLHHVVSISAARFFPRNQRPGSDTGHRKKSIGGILVLWVLNLGGGTISEDLIF